MIKDNLFTYLFGVKSPCLSTGRISEFNPKDLKLV